MAATSSGKFLPRKLLFLGGNFRVCLVKSFLDKSLPCSSYATFAGKSASRLMQKNEGQRPHQQGRRPPYRGGRDQRNNQQKGRVHGAMQRNPSRAVKMKPESTDWPSVFSGPQSYNPAIIPVFLRMGRRRHNRLDNFPNRTMANLELMKVPNFFHLTPPAIERHCKALEPLCKPWPSDVDLSSKPLRITTRNYLFAGPSLYHPGTRKVKIQVFLKDLILDDHARSKLIDLVGPRYNADDDSLTIVTERCPTRQQNKDYALYLLTVLYHEAWKTEPWEVASGEINEEEEEEDIEGQSLKRRRSPSRLRLLDDKLYRFNKYGKGFELRVKVKV